MSIRRAWAYTSLFAWALACASPPPPPPPPPPPTVAAAPADEERARQAWERESLELDTIETRAREEIPKLENSAVSAVRFVLAQSPLGPGQPLPYPATTSIEELRSAKIVLRIEPMSDSEGRIHRDLLILRDSYTDRVPELTRKIAEKKATWKERSEVRQGAKYQVKLGDLGAQVRELSRVLSSTDRYLASECRINTVKAVATIVGNRRAFERPFTEQDVARIRRILDLQHRAEAVATGARALMAAFQTVVNDNGDPKALDVAAEAALAAFAVKPSTTVGEAQVYVQGLLQNIDLADFSYKAWLRDTLDEAQFEQAKTGMDAAFTHYRTLASRESNRKTDRELARHRRNCAMGLPVPHDSPYQGQVCQSLRDLVVQGIPVDSIAPEPP